MNRVTAVVIVSLLFLTLFFLILGVVQMVNMVRPPDSFWWSLFFGTLCFTGALVSGWATAVQLGLI